MTELSFTGDAAAETAAPAAAPEAAAASSTAPPDAAAPAGANPWQIEHKGRDGAVTKVDVPEPFRNSDGSVNIAAALKAHADLRQQLSTRPTAPERYDFAAIIPEEAKSVLGDVLVDGAPLLPKAEAWGKKWNLPPEAMGEALSLLAERDGLLGQAGEADSSTAQEQAWAEAVQLVGSREKAEGIGRRFATALGLTDKDPPIGLPPQALPLLEKLLEKAGAGTVTTTRDVAATAAVTEADLETMMRDPKYWKQKDPAFIAQVTEGFQKLYGGQKQA
ncbi:hypothetical protein [Magnetospirillum sulfuroxidans]|uniref:Uncharacterized protein n=1 Tax=Magnetospirillum sulfuroxidans TaxID=611300 RepID=A0ABS5I8Q0_9PROT|nr:hypothetical protein [Magnetospirillum sulfuroxidans]MBR9970814.1 hypothetical protein [Magnetospirillum sulfuroxidans]